MECVWPETRRDGRRKVSIFSGNSLASLYLLTSLLPYFSSIVTVIRYPSCVTLKIEAGLKNAFAEQSRSGSTATARFASRRAL